MAITAIQDKNKVQKFAGTADVPQLEDSAYCTVLYGYGKVDPNKRWFVDKYQCVGGVIRNVLRTDAENWAKGVRFDGKPTVGRIYIQAILPVNATEADFILATGMNRVSTDQLVASLSDTDAKALIEALGAEGAAALALSLTKELNTTKK